MVYIGISKHPPEYRVWWKRDGIDDEGKAYYTDDEKDAVVTLIAIYNQYLGDVKVTSGIYTRKLLEKYGYQGFPIGGA